MLVTETNPWFILVYSFDFRLNSSLHFLRFIGVLVYSSNWNHFWQINKTLALVLTYIYCCINPFALYFLSSTFRHFYKRYLCFWRNINCCPKAYLTTRRHTRESALINDYRRRSSGSNTASTVYYDLNRIKHPNYS
jgi:hypothetical protein